jgi:hypothetical protein
MSDIKVIFEDDDYIEYEITQPNDILGDTEFWDENDWKTWNEKMARLEDEGIRGEDEVFTVKFEKKPKLDGAAFTRKISEDGTTTEFRQGTVENPTQGFEI